MPPMLKALRAQHDAVNLGCSLAEDVHKQGLWKHPQGLPHVGHVGRIVCLPWLHLLTPYHQAFVHKVSDALLLLRQCR